MDVISSKSADGKFMRAAIFQARKSGITHPNPVVGAVVVKNNRILSRGFHRGAGHPHAEIEALSSLKSSASSVGATLYITLEPCSTHGRTPPCTEAIIRGGITRVVYGATDPNPKHAGRARNILKRAGIAVSEGILSAECTALNTAWNKWIATGMPYIIAKAGMTLDGRISSPPARRWITSEAARKDAMHLRSKVQAILVGGETVRTDNPRLTLRGMKSADQPWRVVWSRSGSLPKTSHLFTDTNKDKTLVFIGQTLPATLRALGRLGIASVLIEGGGRVHGEAFDRQLVDEVCFYLAPLLAGGPVSAVAGTGASSPDLAVALAEVRYVSIGQDIRVSAKVVKN